MAQSSVLRGLAGAIGALGALLVVFLVVRGALAIRRALPDDALDVAGPGVRAAPDSSGNSLILPDSLRGRSGQVQFAAVTGAEAAAMPGLLRTFGDTILERPRVLMVPEALPPFSVIVMRPFAAKRGEHVGAYRLGQWPAERWMMAANYLNPDGFIEVHPATANLALSPHFTVGMFLTRDQLDTWPKYVIVDERLIDKLELVLGALGRRGVATDRVGVLSGFRAPYYNDRALDEGAVRSSRHQYGDAADIIIDADGDGRMDDLTGDGRVDLRDARVIGDAVREVENRYPDLIGGLGTYAAIGPSGPFAHVDVRGTSARWENRNEGQGSRAKGRR